MPEAREKRSSDIGAPRLLVIGGVPPGSDCVGAIILRDLCTVYPEGRMACFSLVANMGAEVSAAVPGVALSLAKRAPEKVSRTMPGPLGALQAMTFASRRLRPSATRLVDEAVAFGREFGAEKVWMVLDSISAIAMGPMVARRLGLPMVSLVWDHPRYLMRESGLARTTRDWLMKRFGETLGLSESVAVVSHEMADDFARDYGVRPAIMRHGLSPDMCRPAPERMRTEGPFTIGFAGGMYAYGAWDAFVEAIARGGGKIGGREVLIRVMGSDIRLRSSAPCRIEFLGWRDTEETARLLADCDITYLPQPFSSGLRELAHYSFPTKLSTYVAAGKPVFVHAPEHASMNAFMQEHPLGVFCGTLEPARIADDLATLATDEARYLEAARCSVDVARNVLSMERFYAGFAACCGIDLADLRLPREGS